MRVLARTSAAIAVAASAATAIVFGPVYGVDCA